MLTWSHSQLAALATAKDEWDEHAQKMLQYAKEAEKIAEKFEGGCARACYLCRAWESMELAEKYEAPDRFAEAANLFTKASELFTDSKLKLLASRALTVQSGRSTTPLPKWRFQ